MKYATRHISLCAVLSAVLVAFYASLDTAQTQDRSVRSDVTIYLDGPLLDRGGTVFVVPREVPVEDWKPRPDLPNPARSDPRLDDRRPIGEFDRRLSALASERISVVRFDYSEGGSFNFRFLPLPDSGHPPERLGSVLVTVGNTYDYHPETREKMFIPRFQVLTILGPDADESESRALVSSVKLGYLQERYGCDQFESVVSCKVEDDAQ